MRHLPRLLQAIAGSIFAALQDVAIAVVVSLAGSGACLAAVAAGPIVLLGDANYPPLTYLENGQPKGLAVDIARALGKRMGREIRIELMDWQAAQEKIV